MKVMGILNVTPDSFYDGGRHVTLDKALARALTMVEEGVDIIDVGGESTRPFATPLTESEECERVIPLITRLKQEVEVPISIDSRHSSVIREALAAGASIVNDISALQDPASLKIIAKAKVPVCIMHMQGQPDTMQQSPHYDDVLFEVTQFLQEKINQCEQAGIQKEHIWIDPGFGFGKTLAHNLTLLGKLDHFKKLGCPILVGLSRKAMFGQILDLPVEERLYGSLAGAVIALLNGADIIRVHDVRATKHALKVVAATKPYLNKNK
jgi:dihydropteroate synthase